MKLGLVGLPNVGKTMFFNSLTRTSGTQKSSAPSLGLVSVPDARLDFLEGLYEAKKKTPATIEFVDIAGLSSGGGLGNKLLGHIREVDALVHIVRCFDDDTVMHVYDGVDAARDVSAVNTELILADLEVVERRLEKEQKQKGDKFNKRFIEILSFLNDGLSAEICVRDMDFSKLGLSPEDNVFLGEMSLLSAKKVIYACNVNDDDVADEGESNPHAAAVRAIADKEGASCFALSCKLEEELSALPDDERLAFMEELGSKHSGQDQIVSASYALLGLVSFLTAGPKEVRAWTIHKGSSAPKAAGKIHSDLERGFIRAEVVAYSDLERLGTHQACKEAGLVRSEGKEYIVKDGDVILFRFNV